MATNVEDQLFIDPSPSLLPAARWKSLPITSSRARVAFRVDSRASARNYAKLHRRERERERKKMNEHDSWFLSTKREGLKKATRWNLARVENTVPWDKVRKFCREWADTSLNWRFLERICSRTQVQTRFLFISSMILRIFSKIEEVYAEKFKLFLLVFFGTKIG